MKHPTTEPTVHTWLAKVEKRPTMWFPADSLELLEAQVHGYYNALLARGIVESGPSMQQGHFGVWLHCARGWSQSAGWAYAITKRAGVESATSLFFSLWREYRQLTASTVAVVHIESRHFPRRKRALIGAQKESGRPEAIELRTYDGTELYHFRWHLGKGMEDAWILMDTTGSFKTSPDYAKTRAYDEFGIQPECWSSPST